MEGWEPGELLQYVQQLKRAVAALAERHPHKQTRRKFERAATQLAMAEQLVALDERVEAKAEELK